MRRIWIGAALALLAVGTTMPVRPEPVRSAASSEPVAQVTELRVMSYNVKGLPWPVAGNRPEQLAQIGVQLAELRRQHRHPQIVLVQEAFTAEAKAIGRAAGYRYVAFGPRPSPTSEAASVILGPEFAAQASAMNGEGLGQWLDSGLAIFSDFPIAAQSAWAFPQGACAGFDCLAAKGVQVARIVLPGQSRPLTLVNTHLNSDVSSSGVDVARTDAAFAWQYAAFRDFVGRHADRRTSVIAGGDVNIGPSPHRRAQALRIGAPLASSKEAVEVALALGLVSGRERRDTLVIHAKRIDRLFYRSGPATPMTLVRFAVPFTTGSPESLSDHAGFMATYRLERGAWSARAQAAQGQLNGRAG